MKRFRALRALARVESREMRRHPARSLLVVLLVAVPVAALVGGSALFETTRPTLEERRARALGRAALRVEWGMDRELAAVRAFVPEHARSEPVVLDTDEVHASGLRLAARVLALDPEGLARGMVIVQAGRAPRNANELALSLVLLEGLECALGESVELGDGIEREIVGQVVAPEAIDLPLALLAPDATRTHGARSLLIDLPADEAAELAARLRAASLPVIARAELVPDDGFESTALFVLAGFGFFEAALVVAAAFAVSMRRRQREIGLLAASGATVGALRASIALSAVALALAGCVLGVAVGVGAAAALHPFVDGWNGRCNGALELSSAHMLGALALGVLAAVAAAAVPAHGVTRLPVRVALGGRRPVTASARGWVVLGVALFALGLAAIALGARFDGAAAGVAILCGSGVAVLGLAALCPWLLVVLARCAAPLPLAWRLALRDAGRFRARNGPVVTAVLAGMSISVLVAALMQSVERSVDARAAQPVEHEARGLPDELEAPAPAPSAPPRVWLHVLLGISVSTGLVVILIATALSSLESAADARVLHAVGAAPELMRLHVAARAGYLAFLGCALAIPAGLVPAAGLMRFADVELDFALPWPQVSFALCALPGIAFACTWSAAFLRSSA